MRYLASQILIGAGLLLAVAPALAAPDAPHICIDSRQIEDSTVKDHGAALLFKMRDGTQWRNELQGRCPDLAFNGYIWTVRNPGGSVCEFEQSFRVLESGEICSLGKFTKVTPTGGQSKG